MYPPSAKNGPNGIPSCRFLRPVMRRTAAAVPRFSSAIATANTVKVQADLTALDTAIVLYQTAKGKAPGSIDDLTEYVTDLKNLKPPSGSVRVGDQEVSMENAAYKVEKKAGVWRATCAGRTAEEYHAKQ